MSAAEQVARWSRKMSGWWQEVGEGPDEWGPPSGEGKREGEVVGWAGGKKGGQRPAGPSARPIGAGRAHRLGSLEKKRLLSEIISRVKINPKNSR